MCEGFGLNREQSIFTVPSGSFTGGTGENYGEQEYQAIYEGRKIDGPGGWYEGDTFEGMADIYEKPTFIPPHYYDDDFKKLSHRYTQSDFFFRIGDSRFVIPPTQIRVSEESKITKFQSIRQKQSMKVATGGNMKTIEMSLMFTDFDQVNGYEMEGPDGQVYYMDGLRSLLAQMKTMPFLPVENEFLNLTHGIYGVAILAVNVGVVDGFPGMLKADLTLVEFDAEPYLNKPGWMYDSHFIWPLFRWHYQRLLNGETTTGDTLAPYVGDDILDFWYLDEALLEDHGLDIEKQQEAEDDMKEGERHKTWWDYNDKLESARGTNAMFTQHVLPPNYRILDINATFGNNLTPLTPALTGSPTFQYFGSQDAQFNILIETSDSTVIKSFNELKARVDRYAREYRDGFVSSMLRLNNNFVSMLGVKGVLIESMSTSTVEGSPGSFYISMSLVSFDETQHADEKLGRLDTIDFQKISEGEGNLAEAMTGANLENFDNNIVQAVAAEAALNQLELYPDLELPTYAEVNEAIDFIDNSRKANGFGALGMSKLSGPTGARHVDPDFYFSYPDMHEMVKAIETSMLDKNVAALALEAGENVEEYYGQKLPEVDVKEFFGTKALALLEGEQNSEQLKEAFKELGYGDLDSVNARWQELRSFITDPQSYTSRFWMKAWSGESGQWDTKSANVEDSSDKDWKVAYYNKQSAQASVQVLTEKDFFNGMMHDMIKYDRRGTMMRAFPSYVFVIIDEGKYVNVRKLWDNYYTYHSISEISVHMDRVSPIHTAYITLSNVYGALNNKGTYHQKLKDPSWKTMVDGLMDSFQSDVTKKELLERATIYESLQLLAGARIHIRLGYGACASQLPPVFNGVIAEINTGDMVSIVAQSFGVELTNEVGAEPGQDTSMFEEGLESTEMFRYYMTERNSNYTYAWRDSAEPESYQSAYGIEHFGYLRVRDEQTPSDVFSSWHWDKEREINAEDYDIMKNVYSTIGYRKVGVDEDAKTGSSPDAKLSGLKKDAPIEDLRKQVLGIWDATEIPNILKYKDAKPDFKKLNVEDEFLFNERLDTIKTKPDAKEFLEEINKPELNTKERRALLDALYWWAASPVTYSSLSGTSGKWASKKGKKNEHKKNIENFFSDIKKLHPNLYKEAVAQMNAIANEWGAVSYALETYLNEDIPTVMEKAIDIVTPGSEDDEKNIRMQLEGKAPWDIFRTLERVTPEYVVYPHIHQFGYTLFFGKPWWDVQCSYVLPPVKGKKDKLYGKKISDYVELSKPFSQLHLYSSYGDIIANNIKAVGTDLATAVIPVFQLGRKDESYEVIWADYYIRGSFQKTRTIDTSLIQNIPVLPSWLEKSGTAILGIFDGSSKYQKHAVRFAQGVIAETFKGMYQGELIVFGDGSVKPYDIMYIDDFYTKMNGTADVGGVTHMLSVDTGFITSIKPDLSVIMNPDPGMYSKEWSTDPSIASGNFFRYSHVVQDMALQGWRLYSGYKIAKFVYTSKSLRSMAVLSKFGTAYRSLSTAYKTVDYTTRVGRGVSGASRVVSVVRGGLTAFRANALRTAGVSLLLPGPGTIGAFVSVASAFAATLLIEGLDHMYVQKYNNVIKLFPLFYKGTPFVAGINGHKQLIPGWEDNGNGKPVRVDYDNVKEYNPPINFSTMSDAEKDEAMGVRAPSIGGQQDIDNVARNTGDSVTDNTKVNAEPAKWLGRLKKTEKKMFAAPIMLGSEGVSFAGMNKRMTSGYLAPGRPTHHAIDFGQGKPDNKNRTIIAFADGTVMSAGRFLPDQYGSIILIKHKYMMDTGDPYVFYSFYCHMHANEIMVEAGDTVKAGQSIALMGNTGNVRGKTGIHLHFEIMLCTDSKKSDKIGTGKKTLDHVFASGRPHTTRINPLKFMEQIIAFKSDLMQYVKYKL
jgi:murein DD-endopeptidase MepM/ murein hydrolase activator NlpD